VVDTHTGRWTLVRDDVDDPMRGAVCVIKQRRYFRPSVDSIAEIKCNLLLKQFQNFSKTPRCYRGDSPDSQSPSDIPSAVQHRCEWHEANEDRVSSQPSVSLFLPSIIRQDHRTSLHLWSRDPRINHHQPPSLILCHRFYLFILVLFDLLVYN
jgi:hypothetical protein